MTMALMKLSVVTCMGVDTNTGAETGAGAETGEGVDADEGAGAGEGGDAGEGAGRGWPGWEDVGEDVDGGVAEGKGGSSDSLPVALSSCTKITPGGCLPASCNSIHVSHSVFERDRKRVVPFVHELKRTVRVAVELKLPGAANLAKIGRAHV